jgi:hypothetical protein
LQFREAELVGVDEYRISGFLRGQGGTEPLIADPAPEGAILMLLDKALIGFDPGEAARGLERHYRIGPAGRDLNDESFQHAVWTHDAVGLRPFSPVGMKAVAGAGGAIEVTWTRRGRRDLDSWSIAETPLYEASERYRLRIRDPGGALVREKNLSTPDFSYDAAAQAADGIGPVVAGVAARFEVAQISENFGPGFEGKATFSG